MDSTKETAYFAWTKAPKNSLWVFFYAKKRRLNGKMERGWEFMQDFEMLERLTKAEERSKSNTHRLDKLEPVINEIHTMSKTLVQLVEEMKHTNEAVVSLEGKVDRMDSRVDTMERAPADDMMAYRRTAVTSIISAVAGAMATGVLVLVANYI